MVHVLRRKMILGAPLDGGRLRDAAAELIAQAKARTPSLVLLRDAHGVMRRHWQPSVAAAEAQATHVFPDGRPLAWIASLAGLPTERIYGPDLMLETCCQSARCQHDGPRPLKHLLLGGGKGVANTLAATLRARFPGLDVCGTLAPQVADPLAANDALIGAVNAFGADILWVGLGCPKQDLWMARHRSALTVPVVVGCGAAFDFHAGTVRQAPRWMMNSGLEWAFRLAMEPRRLVGRYAWVVPSFCIISMLWLLRERLRSRR